MMPMGLGSDNLTVQKDSPPKNHSSATADSMLLRH
jgi:hypothetical protein